MEKNQKHRQHFADTIDTRIDFLAKKKSELNLVEKILKTKKTELQFKKQGVALPRAESTPALALSAIGALQSQAGVNNSRADLVSSVEVRGGTASSSVLPVGRKGSAANSDLWLHPESQKGLPATASDAVLSPAGAKGTPSAANTKRTPSGG